MSNYKLMPEKATPEMEQAAEKYWNDRRFKGLSDDPRTWAGVYQAMRAVAPTVQTPPNDPLGGLEYRADGEANFYTLSKPTGNWIARIQFNGELHVQEQERILNAMLRDRNVCFGDGYYQGYWDARQDSPTVTDEMIEVVHRIWEAASKHTLLARIPECGEFSGIAQDAGWLLQALKEMKNG